MVPHLAHTYIDLVRVEDHLLHLHLEPDVVNQPRVNGLQHFGHLRKHRLTCPAHNRGRLEVQLRHDGSPYPEHLIDTHNPRRIDVAVPVPVPAPLLHPTLVFEVELRPTNFALPVVKVHTHPVRLDGEVRAPQPLAMPPLGPTSRARPMPALVRVSRTARQRLPGLHVHAV